MVLLIVVGGCGRISFDPSSDAAADARLAIDATVDAPRPVLGPGSWAPTPPSPLAPRLWTSAVWTGVEYIVMGGALDIPAYNQTPTGARFDPAAQTWRAMSTAGAPNAHTQLLAWSGRELLVFGGAQQFLSTDEAGRYDPSTDTWAPISAVNKPSPRVYGVGVWIGTRWFVWGGYGAGQRDDGGLYDPATDTWTPLSTVGAPSGRSFAHGVWTGTEVIVWGGCDGPMGACPGMRGDGGIYNPTTNTWRVMSGINAPAARADQVAAWSGSEMIVFMGATTMDLGSPIGDGGRYDPATDTWRPLSTTNAPGARVGCASGWMSDKLVIWGSSGFTDGFLYDPTADQWSPITSTNAPSRRQRFAYATSARSLLVWGGSQLDDTGAIWTAD